MTLGERIQYYRKCSGFSQESLAERLGVSRQAVSKWETDESTPDALRIIRLAEAFGISTDTLLLGREDPAPDMNPEPPAAPASSTPEWVEHLPRHLASLFRRKGYIAGYILAAYGAVLLVMTRIAHYIFRQMMYPFSLQQMGFDIPNAAFGITAIERLPLTFCNIFSIIGLVIMVGGIALALIWKKKSQ